MKRVKRGLGKSGQGSEVATPVGGYLVGGGLTSSALDSPNENKDKWWAQKFQSGGGGVKVSGAGTETATTGDRDVTTSGSDGSKRGRHGTHISWKKNRGRAFRTKRDYLVRSSLGASRTGSSLADKERLDDAAGKFEGTPLFEGWH